MRQQWVGHDRCCLPPPRRPISHAGGVKPTLAGPHRQSAPAATLWICGRREEAPPTTPQGQQQKKQSKAVFVQPTQDSKEAKLYQPANQLTVITRAAKQSRISAVHSGLLPRLRLIAMTNG